MKVSSWDVCVTESECMLDFSLLHLPDAVKSSEVGG